MLDFLDTIISEPLKDLYVGLKNETSLWKKLKYDVKKYIQDLGDELNEYSVHRANKIIKLSSMFVEPKLLDKIISESYFFDFSLNPDMFSLSPDVLEYLIKRNPKALIQKKLIEERNYTTINELINNYNKFIVLGQPGSGKTTILRKIVIDIAKGVGIDFIPVYIPLRNSILKKISLIEFIQKQFQNYGIQNADLFTKRLLEKGKLILLYDGIDEIIGSERQRILEEINILTIEYPLNKNIATSRTSSYNGELSKFKEVELCEFTLSDATSYVNNWFHDNEMKDRLIEKIHTYPQLSEITNSPLLLSLICTVYEYDLEIATRRSSLYRRCIECLMRDWDAQRNFRRESNFSKLDDLKKISILSNIAYNLHVSGKIYFDFNTIESSLTQTIYRYGLTDNDIPLILEEIVDCYGLILEVSKDVYSFSHLTFQEYFTATHICERRLFLDDTFILNNHPFWEEVYVLCASILPDATEYLTLLLNKSSKTSENVVLTGLCLSVDPVIDLSLKKKIVDKLLGLYHNYKTTEIRQRAIYSLARIDDTFVGNKLLTSLGVNKSFLDKMKTI